MKDGTMYRTWNVNAKLFLIGGLPSHAELCTTLIDINGKDVFEGDKLLIRARDEHDNLTEYFTGIVKFINGTFQCVNDRNEIFTLSTLFDSNDATAEVIGNIHEDKKN